MSNASTTSASARACDGDATSAGFDVASLPEAPGRARIAVFDFDGTSIQGNSPVMLVNYLVHRSMLRKRVIAKILSWGIAYKLHLPQSEAWARSLVFTAFEGWPQEKADAFLCHFYDERIEARGRFRPAAEQAMKNLSAAGIDVVVVSATFGPIVRRAQLSHSFDTSLCTEMLVDAQGRYTCAVDGECIEGEAKVRAVTAWADERYGKDKWTLSAAFGDHHSDRPLLTAADAGFAVTPDSTLSHAAREHGWAILDWDVPVKK